MPYRAVSAKIREYERPKRRALSSRFPALVPPAVAFKRTVRAIKNELSLPRLERRPYLPCVVARHSSPLFRKLGDSDMSLQRNKVTNLRIALERLNGLVIPPGQTFSFWRAVGGVSKRKGYVEGMLLSNGKVSRGVGGGLCQLSNFLMWIFLHADIEIVERHHHSVDAFPDSGRTLPFGSGATVFSNYLDLQVRNASPRPLQLKLWLTDAFLKGQLLSDAPAERKYHVTERNHCFVNRGGRFFRYNEIHRQARRGGQALGEEKVFVNFAPVAYPVSEGELREKGLHVLSQPALY
ncbi:MAG TPA: VanW family protein [Candidatus Paceibacterota bacterium]|nr:VanW family protein [Candidatus Paceibacterota bacterium]